MENFSDSLFFWKNDYSKEYKNKLNIVLLAHVQEPRGYVNIHQRQCNETERFSVEEFNEIYQGIVNAGYYIKAIYYNELDFIADYINCPNRFENCLIYNLARNGLGDNKKTVIPAFCELVGLNYTGSNSLACALCRNKYLFTKLLETKEIPVPKSWLLLEDGTWNDHNTPPDGIKVICKPCSESASQGVSEAGIVISSLSIFKAFKGKKYIVQEYIEGEECEVPVFKIGKNVQALDPVGINLYGKNILDEQVSENYEYGFYDLAERCDSKKIKEIQFYAEKAFKALQMDVYGRIDFRISKSGIPYVFDISTMPYTIGHSSFAFVFKQYGCSYNDIYEAIISAALSR